MIELKLEDQRFSFRPDGTLWVETWVDTKYGTLIESTFHTKEDATALLMFLLDNLGVCNG